MKQGRRPNLLSVVDLAIRNMTGSLDERRDYTPFFTYRLFDRPISVEHGAFDSPHVVGRYLYALDWSRRVFGLEPDWELVAHLERRLVASLDLGTDRGPGLAWNEETGSQEPGAWGHNQREVLLALIALAHITGRQEPMDRASRLVRDLQEHTAGTGRLPGSHLTMDGWKNHAALGPLPAQSGRILRALLEYYRDSGDSLALQLAETMARVNARECFERDGTWTAAAGNHIHSITGMIAGLIELGLYLRDAELLEAGRKAFDHGLQPYRSEFGWVQEFRGTSHERGEANNTGDILQSAVLLARHLDASYWADAEKILRNHLIVSQYREPSWFDDSGGPPDTPQQVYRRVVQRALGGFCFSSPADFKSHQDDRAPINTDLVGGAIHSLCEAHEAGVDDTGRELRVNLLLSRNLPACRIESHLPTGAVDISLKQPRVVLVRIPRDTDENGLRLRIDGQSVRPIRIGPYLRLTERPLEHHARVEIPPLERSATEVLNGTEYEVHWKGETVLAVRGPEKLFAELY
jgi:hypothetical protein